MEDFLRVFDSNLKLDYLPFLMVFFITAFAYFFLLFRDYFFSKNKKFPKNLKSFYGWFLTVIGIFCLTIMLLARTSIYWWPPFLVVCLLLFFLEKRFKKLRRGFGIQPK